MDLIVLFALLIIVIFFFKKLDSVVYFIAIVDIFLRIANFLKTNIFSSEIQKFINTYLPSSIPTVINNWTSGILNEVLIWLFVLNFIIFEIYIIKNLLKKR